MAGRDFSAELFGAAPVQTSVSEEEDRRRRDEAVAILEQERQASLARGDTEGANINAREIDRMQRTNFGKGAPAESGGRDLSAELFGGKDLSAELFKTEAKPTLTQRLKSAFTPKEGPTVGLSDEMTEALKAVTEPEVQPKKVYTGSVFDKIDIRSLPEPPIDLAEAERLSRKDYAERTMRPAARTQYIEPIPEDQLNRSAARTAVDTTIGILQGAVAIPKGITENIPFDNPLSKFFQAASEAGEQAKSPYLRSQAATRAAMLKRVEENQGELAASRAAFNSMFSPAGADIVAQGAGSLIPTVGLSLVGLGSTSLAAMNALANAGDAAQQAAARLAEMPPEAWSNSSAYQELREQGLDHRDAVRVLAPIYALPSQAIGGLTGYISGSTGLERALVKGGARGATARAQRAGAELIGEEAETVVPMITANATQALLDDKQRLFEGVGQAAVETAAGSVPGAAIAAGLAKPERARIPTAAQMMRERGFVVEPPAAEVAPEVAPEVTPPEEPVAPPSPTITRMREQQRATEELEGEALGTETTKALQTETQGPEETATELADRIAAAEAEDTGFRPLTEAQSRRMAALSPSEREARGFPVAPRAPRPAFKVSENPENIGMTGMDEANRPVVDLITAGAKPFPTKKAAEMGKAQRPDMKILKVADGWMLTPMTEADVARGERAGQRISAFQPGKAGMPTAAHEYIMERGGLTFDQQPNTDFPDENPKVGNRRLFSDKGMSLAQAAELLKEAGYIDEETETAAQAAISNSVKGKRVYTPEGYERAATLEKEAQTREAEQAETEAGLYTPEADIYDYRYLEDPFRMPIAEVRTRAEAVGIPYDVIAEDVASRMPDATQEEYEDAVKTEVSNYAKSEGKFLNIRRTPLGFYSALEAGIEGLPTTAAPAAGWKAAIKGLVNKGAAKQDEVDWTGLNDWLDLQQGRVTKEQVQEYLRNGGVQVEEVVLGGKDRAGDWEQIKGGWRRKIGNRWMHVWEPDFEGKVYGKGPSGLMKKFASVEAGKAYFDGMDYTASTTPTKYGQYTLPGGENYREVLLTLPEKVDISDKSIANWYRETYGAEIESDAGPDWRARRQEFIQEMTSLEREDAKGVSYRSSHWDQPNIIAHIRMNDRTDADGNKVLFIEEIQSDWGQEGKKRGFSGNLAAIPEMSADELLFTYGSRLNAAQKLWLNDFITRYESSETDEQTDALNEEYDRWLATEKMGGIPAAPFVTKTEGWLNLALKRIITMAAEGGYDKVAFVTGQQSADRFDLSKQVDSIVYAKEDDGNYSLVAIKDGREVVKRDSVEESALPDLVGKEVAERIINGEGKALVGGPERELTGDGLKVGGEGMKAFYDKIVPAALKKLLPKVGGGQMGVVEINNKSQPGFDVTPAMRETTQTGVPLFQIANKFTSEIGQATERSPSLKRKVKTLRRQRLAGKISDAQFIEQTDAAIDQDEAARLAKAPEGRLRGADRIREVLLAAKRRGELSPEAVELAEWFIKQNEKLLDDLAVSVKSPERGTAGRYEPMYRLMILMKEAGSDNTIVHEILHHLERMMPEPVRKAIRKEWMRQLMLAQKKAKTPAEKLYFAAIMANHFGEADMSFADMNKAVNDLVRQGRLEPMKPLTEGDSAALHDLAINLARDGAVPMSHYQYVNPSEFWAVKGSDIVQGRYNAIRGGVLARLKNWLKELAQTLKSVFGFKSDAPIIQALDSLSKSDGRFMTDKMLMEGGETFLQVGRNIYNRRPLVQWNTPDETKLDSFIYTMQDKLVDTKRVIQDIERATGAIDDRWNPYLQEELYHGRTATATKDFLASEVRPLLEEMQKEDVSIADLEEYLHNRFAETRNNNIAQINPTMPDGGSGIMTADAQAYLAGLTPEQKRKYERLASKVYAITQGTRDYLVGSGLEEQDTINAWEASSPDYVPLNRGDVEYSTTVGTGTGQGYSVKGPSTRTATGSLRPVVNILANVIAQRERAIVRGEKNRVATALYGLALQNPNPEFWLAVNPDATKNRRNTTDELVNMGLTPAEAEGLMQEPAKKVVDPQTGLVTQRVNPVLRNADNVLAVRINGKDRFVFFNTTNPRAVRMVTALKNLDADQLGWISSNVAVVTRYFSSINTQYNPVFGIYNFLRDYQGGAIQLSGTPLADSRWEVLNPVNVAGAMNGIYQTLRAERARKPQLMTPWADLWIEFTREGGQTGYRDMFSRAQERADALKSELDRLRESGGKKAALAAPRAVFNWLADYNETLENAVRLTAYKAALDKGLSKEQAASLAKNLTVNFNRKGQIGTQAGAWYSFFNSGVQGTTRLLGTVAKMKRPGDIKSLSLTKAGKVLIYGGLLAGVIQAMSLAAFGFDEDEPPDFVKDRNLIIPIGDGKYLAWPLPLGYHVIPAFSRIITEWALSGGKNTGKVVSHLTSLLFDAFSPIGNAGWSLQSVLPTIFDPMAALFENKDWTGKPIAKEDFNKLDPTPGYTRAKQNASWVGDEFAYFVNALTGGDADKPGIISPTPDQIDFLIGQATGGLGREILKATKTGKAMVTGEELPPYNIPLVGRFYGNSKAGYAESQRFYNNIQELNILHNQLEGRQKRKEDPAKFLQENPKVRLYEAAMATQRNVQNLRKQRDALIEKDAPKESVKAVENNITNQMKKLNEKVKQFEAASKNKKEPAPTE